MKKSLPQIPRYSAPAPVEAFPIMAVILAIVVAYTHWRPTMTYPLPGLWLGVSYYLLGALGLVIICRLRALLSGIILPLFFLTLFAAYAWGRTFFSTIPSDGMAEASTFMEGIILFLLGGVFVVVAPHWKPARLDKIQPREVLGYWLIAAFAGMLALAFSVHAILEYHVIYAAKLAALKEQGLIDRSDPISEGIEYALNKRRVGSQFGNPNVLCGFLAMCLPMVLALAWDGAEKWRRLLRGLWVVTIALMLYAAFRTGSMGGWIVMAMAGAVTIVLLWVKNSSSVWRRSSISMLVVISLAGGWAAFHLSSAHGQTLPAEPRPGFATTASIQQAAGGEVKPSGGLRQARTIEQRAFYIRSGMAMIEESPWFGHGLGAFGRLYPQHRILGSGETKYAHNFILQIAAETGLIGLSLFLCFIAILLFRLYQALRYESRSPYRWAIGLAAGAFLLDALGEYTFYVREVFLDFCFLAGALCFVPGANAPSTERAQWPVLTFAAFCCIVGMGMAVVPSQMGLHYERLLKDIWQDIGYVGRQMASDPGNEQLYEEQTRLVNAALEYADRGLKWQRGNPFFWQMRAHGLIQMNHRAEGLLALENAAALNPHSAALRSDLANLEWRLGNQDRALNLIRQAVELHPLASEYHLQAARYYLEMEQRDRAIASARTAYEVAYDDPERERAKEVIKEITEK